MQIDRLAIPLKHLFDRSSDLVQAMSLTGQILYVNQAWQSQLGYDKTDVLGKNWLDLIHISCRDRLALALAQHSRQEALPLPTESLSQVILVTNDGKEYITDGVLEQLTVEPQIAHHPLASYLFCLWKNHVADGALTLDIGRYSNDGYGDRASLAPQHLSNITSIWDRPSATTHSAHSSNEHYVSLESAFNNAHDAIVITEAEPINSPEGPKIIYVNPAFTKNTGYTPDEVIGQTPRLLQGPKTNRILLDQVRQALKNWKSIDVELVNYRKDGSEFWVEMTIIPIADATGWYTHWMAIQRNVTGRKTLEEEILKALSKERELNDLKTRFIAITSHEFRTPLTSIMSSVEILDYFENTEDERRKLFDQIYISVHHLSKLLDDVLFIGRADGDRLRLSYEKVDLIEFCLNMLDESERSFGKNHQFTFYQNGIPSLGYLEPRLLRQIITNLLSNAVKYSNVGSLIDVKLAFQTDTCSIQVTDQGIGIPEAEQSRLFDFFYRGSNVNDIAGTGLGLAIVKRSVDLLEGAIVVESQPQHGTTITVTIPLNHRSSGH